MGLDRTQMFADAFILWLSGAAELKGEREVVAYSNSKYTETVEFVFDSPAKLVVYRGYMKETGKKKWEVEYVNGVREGTYCLWDNNSMVSNSMWHNGEWVKDI